MITPSASIYLKKFNEKGSAPGHFFGDFGQIMGKALGAMSGWAFKDVIKYTIGCLENTPSTFATDWDTLGKRVTYTFSVFVICILATAVAAFIMIIYKVIDDSNNNKKDSYFYSAINAPPVLVGVGFAWGRLGQTLFYFYPGVWIPSDDDGSQKLVAEFMLHLILTLGVSNFAVTQTDNFMQWRETAKLQGREIDPHKQTLFEFSEDEFTRIFFKAQKFVFAWSWHLFCKRCYFKVAYNCRQKEYGVPMCSDGTDSFFMNLSYAVIMTVIAIQYIPKLKAAKGNLMRIHKVFISTFMVHDHIMLRYKKEYENILSAFFGIVLGKAYIHVAGIMCSLRLTPECPAEMSLLSFDTIKYGLVVVCYTLLATFFYHNFMEGQRFTKRTLIVLGVADGDCGRLFQAMDKDSDGMADRDEIEAFFMLNGIEAEPFMTAFDHLDLRDGSADGQVSFHELEEELQRVMKEIKHNYEMRKKEEAKTQKV